MLACLVGLALANQPIILVPGAFRSRLNITSTRKAHWYCPKVTNGGLWIKLSYFIPPFLNCWFDWMTLTTDKNATELRNMDGVSIMADDFGGVNGVRGTASTFFGAVVAPYFNNIINRLEGYGYQVRSDLFAAPYDWRLGLAQPDSYFDSLQNLIEEAYSKNNDQKVTVIAHSLGCQVTNRFLTEKTTPEWREKYLNQSVYIAPSWSGAGTSFVTTWLVHTRPLKWFKRLVRFVRSLQTLHIHFPHLLAYGNETLFRYPSGMPVTARGFPSVLMYYGMTDRVHFKMAYNNYKFLEMWPVAPDVKLSILYNSGVKTVMGLDTRKWFGLGTPIYAKGDGLVGSKAIEWVCQNWNITKGLQCHDVNNEHRNYKHKNLLFSQDTIDVIMEWALGKKPMAKTSNTGWVSQFTEL